MPRPVSLLNRRQRWIEPVIVQCHVSAVCFRVVLSYEAIESSSTPWGSDTWSVAGASLEAILPELIRTRGTWVTPCGAKTALVVECPLASRNTTAVAACVGVVDGLVAPAVTPPTVLSGTARIVTAKAQRSLPKRPRSRPVSALIASILWVGPRSQ